MTTVSQIVTDAYRQSNLLAIGASPTSPQQTEALRYLNRVVKSVFGHEIGESLTAFPIGRVNISRPAGFPWYDPIPDNNWFIPKNCRLVFNLDESIDLYLHPAPNDGTRFAVTDIAGSFAANPVTIYGNGNLIGGAATATLNTNGLDAEWFYRADTGNWVQYAPLLIDDSFPFPEEFDDFFITMLAIRLNPAYGASIDGQSQAVLTRATKQIRARYSQNMPTPSETGLIRLSRISADRDAWVNSDYYYDPNSTFARGWPW